MIRMEPLLSAQIAKPTPALRANHVRAAPIPSHKNTAPRTLRSSGNPSNIKQMGALLQKRLNNFMFSLTHVQRHSSLVTAGPCALCRPGLCPRYAAISTYLLIAMWACLTSHHWTCAARGTKNHSHYCVESVAIRTTAPIVQAHHTFLNPTKWFKDRVCVDNKKNTGQPSKCHVHDQKRRYQALTDKIRACSNAPHDQKPKRCVLRISCAQGADRNGTTDLTPKQKHQASEDKLYQMYHTRVPSRLQTCASEANMQTRRSQQQDPSVGNSTAPEDAYNAANNKASCHLRRHPDNTRLHAPINKLPKVAQAANHQHNSPACKINHRRPWQCKHCGACANCKFSNEKPRGKHQRAKTVRNGTQCGPCCL